MNFNSSNKNQKYPHNKDHFRRQHAGNSAKPDEVSQAINEFLNEVIVLSFIGMWTLVKSIFSRRAPLTIAFLVGSLWGGYYISTEAIHFKLLHASYPEFFNYDRIMFLYKIHRDYYWATISFCFLLVATLIVGWYMRSVATKYKKMFCRVGLKNSIGETPKLIKKKKIDEYRKKYIFDSSGVGLTEFEAKKERLEAYFQHNVESMRYGKHKGRIEVTLNKQDFPTKVLYSDLAKRFPLPPESFFVGESMGGVLTQSIAELPHIIIAGTTGSGKSVCAKQILMGLLESTPHLQMYLVDLKGGLEMIDFVKAPNVKVVKTMDETLDLFRQVEREMKIRFGYLEEKGKKSILPKRDKKDRIVVVVDEASVLYMSRGPHDPDKDNAIEARNLADSIAKLSRAAAIHLVLATQKVENKVIPTSVTENISGRMVFRVNSFQGSNQVIGTKAAMMLPEIPGRGIWHFGTKTLTIQAPFIDEKTIQERCQRIAENFQSKRRKCFTPMVEEVEVKKGQELNKIASDMVSKKTEHEASTPSDEI